MQVAGCNGQIVSIYRVQKSQYESLRWFLQEDISILCLMSFYSVMVSLYMFSRVLKSV